MLLVRYIVLFCRKGTKNGIDSQIFLPENEEGTDVFPVLKNAKMEIFFSFRDGHIIFFINFAPAIELTKKKT